MIRDPIYRCFPFLRCSPLLWPSFSFNPLKCDERGIRHEHRVWDLPSVSGSQGELGEWQKVTNLGGGEREAWNMGAQDRGRLASSLRQGFPPILFSMNRWQFVVCNIFVDGWKLLKLPAVAFFPLGRPQIWRARHSDSRDLMSCGFYIFSR